MACSKSNSKPDIHSDKCLHYKTKPKVSNRKAITKIRTKMNEIETRKTESKAKIETKDQTDTYTPKPKNSMKIYGNFT